MVHVYLNDGKAISVSDAVTVEAATVFATSSAATGWRGIVCKDREGKVVAEFRTDTISGYTIES
jgi:hypothetical protein